MTNNEAKRKVRGYLTDMLPSDCSDEIDEIMKALEPKWIPVKDRLPEPKQYVLISTDDAYLKRVNPCLGWRSIENYWHAYTANGVYIINYPLAWMPIPKPYKEDEEDDE